MFEQVKKRVEENKPFYIALGVTSVFIGGIVVGAKYQKKVDLFNLRANLKNYVIFKKAATPLFPLTMGMPEIREALSKMDGAVVNEAVLATVNGVSEIIVR